MGIISLSCTSVLQAVLGRRRGLGVEKARSEQQWMGSRRKEWQIAGLSPPHGVLETVGEWSCGVGIERLDVLLIRYRSSHDVWRKLENTLTLRRWMKVQGMQARTTS